MKEGASEKGKHVLNNIMLKKEIRPVRGLAFLSRRHFSLLPSVRPLNLKVGPLGERRGQAGGNSTCPHERNIPGGICRYDPTHRFTADSRAAAGKEGLGAPLKLAAGRRTSAREGCNLAKSDFK